MLPWPKRKSAKLILPAPIVASEIVVAMGRRTEYRRWLKKRNSSFFGSVLLHALILVGIAVVLNWTQQSNPTRPPDLISDFQEGIAENITLDRSATKVEIVADPSSILKSQQTPDPLDSLPNDLPRAEITLPNLPPLPPVASTTLPNVTPNTATVVTLPPTSPNEGPTVKSPTTTVIDPTGPTLGDIQGRKKWRGEFAISGGGSKSSEAAVERGLRWLKAHQNRDGSWHFNHATGPCNGLCRNPGSVGSTTASTGLALLSFFGAGYSQKEESDYQETIQRGLYYLTARLTMTPQGGDMQEGTMYSQGIATIALCEAYALTKEEVLKDYCQAGIKFIIYAQDQRGGGWRYYPGEPGDTTVTGWQVMALKSAQMAGLEVPSPAFALSQKFLDSVQTDNGAGYGYRTPTKGNTTTSVGLLSRMYLGWDREHPELTKGIEFLEKTGPSADDMYFNYYAAQVLHHADSHGWPRFNGLLREMLVKTQATEGHESGSWYFAGEHAVTGGRLYNTCLSILTLEVYYRYLPLFGEKSVHTKY